MRNYGFQPDIIQVVSPPSRPAPWTVPVPLLFPWDVQLTGNPLLQHMIWAHSGDLHGTSMSILTITIHSLTVAPDLTFLQVALRLIELMPLGLFSRICVRMLWLGIRLRSFHGPLRCVILVWRCFVGDLYEV